MENNPINNTISTLLGLVTKVVDTGVNVVNKGMEFFGLYSTQYSKLIVYGGLLFIASKMLKIKIGK